MERNPVFIYIIPSISFIGVFLNLLCFMIFKSSELKELLYKYLLAETFFNCINLFLQIFRPFTGLNLDSLTLLIQIYEFYLLDYLPSTLEMTSLILHLLSSFDFYFIISNHDKNQKFQFISKLSYVKITLIIFTFSLLAFSYKFFQCEIRPIYMIEIGKNNSYINDRFAYITFRTDFSKNIIFKILDLFLVSFRDGFILLLIIILNGLIYMKVKDSLNKKQSIFKKWKKNKSNNDINSSNNNNNNRVHIKIVVMLLITTIKFMIGRLPILFTFILSYVLNEPLSIFFSISCLSVFISNSFCFFFYLYFNKRFRNVFLVYKDVLIKLIRIK